MGLGRASDLGTKPTVAIGIVNITHDILVTS